MDALVSTYMGGEFHGFVFLPSDLCPDQPFFPGSADAPPAVILADFKIQTLCKLLAGAHRQFPFTYL